MGGLRKLAQSVFFVEQDGGMDVRDPRGLFLCCMCVRESYTERKGRVGGMHHGK